MTDTKYIFVTGGVLSGLGKGVSAASIGRVLNFRGFKVFAQKFDPYLNVDPGTMSPYQHGEVYVTSDGGETDLDLGHYERFIGTRLTKFSNYTSGKIFKEILDDERRGKYLGKTVQIIPHITNKIEEFFERASKTEDVDFIITEIGGTVGDIESQPFLHAITSFMFRHPKNTFVVHTTFVPYLHASREHKSKPTQHSIKLLRSYGINPDLVLLRSNHEFSTDIVNKIATSSLVQPEKVVPVSNTANIYSIPLFFEEKKVGQKILEHFGMNVDLPVKKDDWATFVAKMDASKHHKVAIAMVGKYVEYKDAYMSIIEALKISAAYEDVEITMNWYNAEEMSPPIVAEILKNNAGAIVLPGFGVRGFNGKVQAVHAFRNAKFPTLGICYGMQAMVVDQATRVGIKHPVSREHTDEGDLVIDIIENNVNLGGTLRLGSFTSILTKGSLISKIYGANEIVERHRHRYEVSPKYLQRIADENFIFSGISKEKHLAEICELKNHPFFIGVQYHPEFNATPLNPSPLFSEFLHAITTIKKS